MLKRMKIKGIINIVICIFIISNVEAQLSVNTSLTPQQLVQDVLVGSGVAVSNVTYNGSSNSIGYFTTDTIPTNLGLSGGIIMATGLVNGDGANNEYPIGSVAGNKNSYALGTGSDPDLDSLIPGYKTKDASILEFDFIPLSDTIKFRYVFASEEYPEWVGSHFNDVFGFFISGQNPDGGTYTNYNIAMIPGTSTPVTINNVNGSSYSQYYVDNESGLSIVYDGFTTVITAWCKVTPCISYHIKLAVGDASDSVLDSAVFLEESSFSSNAVGMNTTYSTNVDNMAIEGCNDAIIKFSLSHTTTSPLTIDYTITGTALNGIDYTTIPSSVTILPGQNSTELIISPINDGITEGIETVIITIQTSICGGLQADTVYIRDNTQIIAIAGNDTAICPGFDITLTSSANGGIQPYSYNWSNSAGANSEVTVTPTANTIYIVTISDVCGNTSTDNIAVSLINEGLIVSDDTTICNSGTITLSASGSANYQWSNGITGATNTVSPLQTTVYYVTATNVCSVFDSVVVSVRAPASIIASSASQSICYGSGVSLNVTGGVSYIWSSSPIDSSLVGQDTDASPVVFPIQSTLYTVVGTDEYGCLNTSYVPVIVYSIPIADFSISDSGGCVPVMVSFSNHSQSTDATTHYLWKFGDGAVSSIENPLHTYNTAGIYSVTLITTNGSYCSDTMTLQQIMHIYPLPKAYFAPHPDVVSIFDPVIAFYDESDNAVQREWNMGNGDISTQEHFFYTYSDTGTYLVTLTVWNEYGCVDSTYNYVVVQPDNTIFVPNAFTPNNDSKNDEFKAYGIGLLDYNLKIFNSFGNLIFETNDINEGWNGSTPEGKAPEGVYVYVIKYTDALKKFHNIYGRISLIR